MKPEKLEHLCSMHRFQVAQALAVPCIQCYIDRLTAELAEREADIKAIIAPAEVGGGIVAHLTAENAALREDKERLDWAQSNIVKFLNAVDDWNNLGINDTTTIRAALDAAKEEE